LTRKIAISGKKTENKKKMKSYRKNEEFTEKNKESAYFNHYITERLLDREKRNRGIERQTD
jgi:hypothetical protein